MLTIITKIISQSLKIITMALATFIFTSKSWAIGPDLFLISMKWPNNLSEEVKEIAQQSIVKINYKLEKVIPAEVKNHIKNRPLVLKVIPHFGRAGIFIEGPYKIKVGNTTFEEAQKGLYILLSSEVFKSKDFERTFIHEYFHAIHAVLNPEEETWIKEGMAQMFEYLVLGHLNLANIQWAFLSSSTSLLDSNVKEELKHQQYGINALYFYYLYQQCGKDEIFWNLLSSSKQRGISNINLNLKQLNSAKEQCSNFKESAISFYLALAINSKDYTRTNNPDRFFIYPTTMRANFLLWDKKEDFRKMAQLKTFSPIEINSNIQFLAKNYCQNKCQILYITKIFPFEVSLAPSDSSDEIENYRIFLMML